MLKVLFENHHLYYLPNFIPIIDVMNKRNQYDIYASIPAMMPKDEKNIFTNALKRLNIKIIISENENKRVEIIKDKKFDIIIVGNVGQLNNIVNDDTLAVMVYHGIGLKQSYYNDIDERINIRAVESESRYHKLIDKSDLGNLALTGFTKLDPLNDLNDNDNQILKDTIYEAILRKPKGHDFLIDRDEQFVPRHMNVTGG